MDGIRAAHLAALRTFGDEPGMTLHDDAMYVAAAGKNPETVFLRSYEATSTLAIRAIAHMDAAIKRVILSLDPRLHERKKLIFDRIDKGIDDITHRTLARLQNLLDRWEKDSFAPISQAA